MNRCIAFLPLLSILLLLLPPSLSHPQCLDFLPPFEPRGVSFCEEYKTFGCCSQEQDAEIERRHRSLGLPPRCREYGRRLLCQRCSPYAAHVFDSEATLVERPLPGLCPNFCEAFYDDRCAEAVVPLLTNDTDVLISTESRLLFCEHNAAPDPDYCYPELIDNPILSYNISVEGISKDGCLCLQEIASGLRNPLVFRHIPDGSGRVVIAEQIGVVHVYHTNGSREPEVFLNLTGLVRLSSRTGDERGFLGLAFHPNYIENGRLFIFYTIGNKREGGFSTRISEMRVREPGQRPTAVDPESEKVLLDVKQPYHNHNGGEILFGIDGHLYIFLGDGGSGGDPKGYSQNKESLLGKALRLDVDSPPVAGAGYTVPLDNPFVNHPEARAEIFAYGIRNIWRCDVDEGEPDTGYGRGRIICGDVGQNAFEEIDIIERGGNYGWNAKEGFECFKDDLCGNIDGPEVLPIHAYPHSVGKSVTGGHVYRGCLSPNLQGKYIYGDFVRGKLFALEEDRSTGKWHNTQLHTCGPDVCFNGLTGSYQTNIMSFGEDADGEIYMLTTNYPSATSASGKVYKIVDPKRRGDPTHCRTYKPPPTTSTSTTSSSTSTPFVVSPQEEMPSYTTYAEKIPSKINPPYANAQGAMLPDLYITTCIFLPVMQCVSSYF